MTEGEVVVADCGTKTVNEFDYKKLRDRSYKADDYNVDKTIRDGPMDSDKRRCTDCCFLIVFILFLIGMLAMTIDGYANGNSAYMLAPINQFEQVCGFDDMKDYPYLYAPDLHEATHPVSGFFEKTYCSKSCPDGEDVEVCYADEDGDEVCTTDDTYDTTEILNYCIPTPASLAAQHAEGGKDDFMTDNYFMSMYESRWAIFACIFIALALALIYIKLMDWFAKPIAWITIIMVQLCFIGAGFVAFYYYTNQLSKAKTQEQKDDATCFLVLAIIAWVLALVYLIVVLCSCHSLRVSIAVIDTAADFFSDTKRIVFAPMIYFCLWVCIFIFWLYGLTGIASITDSHITVSSVLTQSKDVHRSDATQYMIYGMCFGMIWISAFIMACNEFAVICAACTWYFSRKDVHDSDGIAGDADVWKGIWWTFRYHAGTLAFGSFILTVVWVIKGMFEYLGNKLKTADGGSGCVSCMVCCCSCCLDCFDRFVRFLE
jgi:hypothetical protein